MRRPWLTLALFLLLAGCIQANEGAPSDPEPPPAGPAPTSPVPAFEDVTTAFQGRLTGTSAQVDTQAFPFEVPAGATAILARLEWTSDQANLGLVLQDPSHKVVESGFRETATTRSLATIEPPRPGTWSVRVTSNRAVQEPFEGQFTVTARPADPNLIEQRYDVRPIVSAQGLATGQLTGFVEINLGLEANQSFNYTWTASAPIYFNIHYHEGDRTINAVEETSTKSHGTFVAPKRQIYSPLWENQGPTTITVEVKIDGVFREHSRTR